MLHLLKVDSEHSSIYSNDINELNEQLIILEGKKHLDESKIHVNEQELVSELKEYEGLFDRYKAISNLYKENSLLKTACGSPCYAAPEMIAGIAAANVNRKKNLTSSYPLRKASCSALTRKLVP